jgi:hypothetical protein
MPHGVNDHLVEVHVAFRSLTTRTPEDGASQSAASSVMKSTP